MAGGLSAIHQHPDPEGPCHRSDLLDRHSETTVELDVAEDAGPAQGAPGAGAVFPGDGDGADASTNGVEKQAEDVQETSPSPTEKQPTDGQEKQTGERQGR